MCEEREKDLGVWRVRGETGENGMCEVGNEERLGDLVYKRGGDERERGRENSRGNQSGVKWEGRESRVRGAWALGCARMSHGSLS